jgi:hypothetical protein
MQLAHRAHGHHSQQESVLHLQTGGINELRAHGSSFLEKPAQTGGDPQQGSYYPEQAKTRHKSGGIRDFARSPKYCGQTRFRNPLQRAM